MKVKGLACLACLILLGLPDMSLARSFRVGDGEVARLWGSYEEIRKVNGVGENRRRGAIARELAQIGSEDARRCLREIFSNDPADSPRLEAMLALCSIGDAKTVSWAVKKAAGEKGYLRLWVGEALQRAKDPAIGPWLAVKSKLLGNKRTRTHAAEALGRLRVAEAREPLLKLLGKSKSQIDLAYETLRALGRIGGEGVKEVLLEAAADKDARRRLAAAEALLEVDSDETVLEAMRKLLADEDGLVREFAARAAGVAKCEALVPELLPRLEDERLRVRPAARGALRSIGSTDLGHDRAAWSEWWKRRKAGGSGDSGGTVARSEDERIFANGVLFLIDTSQSMVWQAGTTTTRLEVAKEKVV
ncbi:MAG: HEAT repeat domain-containing protein, partial [Planctomycetota bacterium]